MTDDRLPDATPDERAFHRLFAEVAPPASILRPRWASDQSAHPRRPGRRLQVALSLGTAVAIAGATFGVLRVAEQSRGSGGHAPSAGAPLSGVAGPPVCVVPAVEYGAGIEPAGGPQDWVGSVTAGFVDCQVGKFIVDPSAPRLGPGDHDLVHLPSRGWMETATVLASCGQAGPTNDCGWSPDGQEFAYGDDSCPTTARAPCAAGVWVAGRVHVVDGSGDRTITPPGEMDRVLGWTEQGIVVARVTQTGTTSAVAHGSGAFLAGDFGATFPDYLVDPSTGSETSMGTTDAFAANGDAVWESDGLTTLVRHDLSNGKQTAWPLPPPGPSATANSGNGMVQLGFDAQGDPLVVTPYGQLLVLTGPGTGEVVGAASTSNFIPGSADSPFDAVSVPGGGLLILDMVAETNTTITIDTLYWNPASGLQDLGTSFSVPGPSIPMPAPGSPGTFVTPTPGQATSPNAPWAAFAGAALTS